MSFMPLILRQPPRHSFFLPGCILNLVILCACCAQVRAAVTVVGDVLPADNPQTSTFEGIPSAGNQYNASEPFNQQTNWERNQDIIVGQKLPQGGRLDIDGNSVLRYRDLIIGDRGEINGQMRTGTGTVLITGVGALYSNDPNSIPPGFEGIGSISANQRDPEIGYDLYVGRYGQGRLELRGGGRAEIQDAVIVGDQPGSSGILVVDGFATLLASGGFTAGPVGGSDIHHMIIGRQGIGTMTISNGGTVLTEARPETGTDPAPIGAVIGSDPFTNDRPEPGGRGTVTLTGAYTRWIIGGTLQVGGFMVGVDNNAKDLEGDNAEYNSETGRGTLIVGEGSMVSLRPAINALPDDELLLAIGRFGRVELGGGLISVGDPGTRMDNIRVLNDGVIIGGGRIETGVFRNRYFGEIRVGAGQKLVIDSSSEFRNPSDQEPFANWGLIQVIGTAEQRAELEFERAPAAPLDPVRPFRNLFVPSATGARVVGQITAAHATLRFRSGLSNQGKLVFTAGDNFVSGPVVNEAASGLAPAGEIAVSGNNTTVTFEDHFINNGKFDIFPNSSLVLFENDFTQGGSGALALTLGGRPTGNELSFLSVMGDASLAGALEVDLFSTGANPINPMPGDQYQILATQGQLSGIFTQLMMPTLPGGLVMFPTYDYLAGTVTLVVASAAGAIGPDFNGDGVIDDADLAIWLANVGITSGATVLQGDADGDGDVDGDDFLFWQRNVGQPPPWTGAGSGSGFASGENATAVPEPAGIALAMFAGLLSCLRPRRRANC